MRQQFIFKTILPFLYLFEANAHLIQLFDQPAYCSCDRVRKASVIESDNVLGCTFAFDNFAWNPDDGRIWGC